MELEEVVMAASKVNEEVLNELGNLIVYSIQNMRRDTKCQRVKGAPTVDDREVLNLEEEYGYGEEWQNVGAVEEVVMDAGEIGDRLHSEGTGDTITNQMKETLNCCDRMVQKLMVLQHNTDTESDDSDDDIGSIRNLCNKVCSMQQMIEKIDSSSDEDGFRTDDGDGDDYSLEAVENSCSSDIEDNDLLMEGVIEKGEICPEHESGESAAASDCSGEGTSMMGSDSKGEGKKEDSLDEEEIHTSLLTYNNRLLQLLECPVCLDTMSTPIMMCANSHSICAHCRDQVEHCPTCRASLTQARNRTAEQLAELVFLRCRHTSAGCLKVFKRRFLECHEGTCEFRRFNCLIGREANCNWMGRLSDIANHVRDEHEIHANFVLCERLQFNFSSSTEGLTYTILSGYGELFLYCQYANRKENMASYFVMFMGPNLEAQSYHYTFDLKSECGTFNVNFSARAHQYVDNIDAIEPGKSLVLGYNMMSTLYVTNTVEILQMT